MTERELLVRLCREAREQQLVTLRVTQANLHSILAALEYMGRDSDTYLIRVLREEVKG